MVDINAIKEAIKTILLTANTTTASVDLSRNLDSSRRVKEVLKTNIERIPIQDSCWPYVSVFTDMLDPKDQDIAKNQATGRRKGDLYLKVAAGVWNDNFETIDEDPADEDLENLMGNIEDILRNNTTLNNTVLWQSPGKVTYHSLVNVKEDAHLRIGIMDLHVRILY